MAVDSYPVSAHKSVILAFAETDTKRYSLLPSRASGRES